MQPSEFFAAGGAVAYPLLGFSSLTLALSGERLVFWSRIHRQQDQVIQEVLADYPERLEQVMRTLKAYREVPIGRIFGRALAVAQRGSQPLTPTRFRIALESAAQKELPRLRRFHTLFETVVTVAPLLGLLGMVTGLIRAFASLSLGNFGSSETLQVTGGVSEALVSTVMGLVVAILILILANLFRSFYRCQVALIQEFMGQLELLYAEQYELQEVHHVRA
jgi:biopolymer transport protein ExbB